MGDLGEVIQDRNVEPLASPFGLLPNGEYDLVIDSAQVREKNDGTGKFLSVQFSVLNSGFESRKLFHPFVIFSDDKTKQQKGQGYLSFFCHTVGLPSIPDDSSELVGRHVVAIVGTRAASGGFEAQNTIREFKVFGAGRTTQVASVNKTPAPNKTAEISDENIPF